MGVHLDNLRKTGLFCDVQIVLKAENKRFHVHRNILASCSGYFRSGSKHDKVSYSYMIFAFILIRMNSCTCRI
jgi:hypothetical protein